MLCVASFAQLPTFGIKGGLNLAKFTLSASQDGQSISLSSKSLPTFNVGVFADVKLPLTNFSVRPELNYAGQGGRFSTTNTEGGVTQTATTDEKLYYLQLPVNLLYHVPVIVGDVYFGAGPYAAKGLSGKIVAKSDDGNGGKSSTSMDIKFGSAEGDQMKSMQYGVDFVAGFKLKNGLLINLNYNLGLSNDVPTGGANGSNKSKVFGASVGYAF